MECVQWHIDESTDVHVSSDRVPQTSSAPRSTQLHCRSRCYRSFYSDDSPWPLDVHCRMHKPARRSMHLEVRHSEVTQRASIRPGAVEGADGGNEAALIWQIPEKFCLFHRTCHQRSFPCGRVFESGGSFRQKTFNLVQHCFLPDCCPFLCSGAACHLSPSCSLRPCFVRALPLAFPTVEPVQIHSVQLHASSIRSSCNRPHRANFQVRRQLSSVLLAMCLRLWTCHVSRDANSNVTTNHTFARGLALCH